MKILVVDDTREQLDAARAQLQGHELMLVDSYDEAVHLFPGGKLSKEWTADDEESSVFDSSVFDVALLDLLMPVSDTAQVAGDLFAGSLMAYGFPLLFRAVRAGIPMVGIITELNHHHHPMSEALQNYAGLSDFPKGEEMHLSITCPYSGESLSANICITERTTGESINTGLDCPACEGVGSFRNPRLERRPRCSRCDGSGKQLIRIKNWSLLLKMLTDNHEKKD